MGRFAQIAKGTRAVKTVVLPVYGEEQPVGVRPMNGAEEGDVLTRGRAYAVKGGVEHPKDGDRLYDLGLMVATLHVACVDPDAPDKPYFDSEQQILEHLSADQIALLYEQQQTWQDECAPRPGKMGAQEFILHVLEIAGAGDEAELPFEKWRPVLRRSFLHTLAAQYVSSLQLKSGSTSATESDSNAASKDS